MKIYYNSSVEKQHCITSKLPNFKEKCLPQNCLRQGKIPKSAYLKYFQTQLKSAYRQILHCSSVPTLQMYKVILWWNYGLNHEKPWLNTVL